MIAKFRKIAAGSYVNDESGVEIHQGETRNWFIYTVVPGHQRDNLATSRNTLASAKVAATAEIAKLAARREADHAQALAEIEAEKMIRRLLPTGITQIEQVDAWIERHGMVDPMGADLIEAREADHVEALAVNIARDDIRAGSVTSAADPAWVAQRDIQGQMTDAEADAYYSRLREQSTRVASIETARAETLGYDAYRTELRTELGKFARGEEPYPYEPEPTIVITTPLTHAETVDKLLDYAQEHEVPYDRLEFAIMAVTGVTAEGAAALIFANSTASLADLH